MLVRKSYKVTAPLCMKIAVLPDFHNGDAGAVMSILEEDPPDIIAVPGDFIRGLIPPRGHLAVEYCESVLPWMRACAEMAPTYVSLGNHEFLLSPRDIEMIRETGVRLLENEWTAAREPRVLIGGLSSGRVIRYRRWKAGRDAGSAGAAGDVGELYPFNRREIFASEPEPETEWLGDFARQDGFKILLAHHPEYWTKPGVMLRDREIDVVLSGHAHGGQIQIMGRGLLAPDQGLLPEYTHGMYEGPHGRMIISRGVTNSVRAPRWGNPCEVVYVELAKED